MELKPDKWDYDSVTVSVLIVPFMELKPFGAQCAAVSIES